MANKKILAVIYTGSFGGPHNQVKQLNRGLKEVGYEYSLCAPPTEQLYQSEFKQQGINVYNYDPSRIRFQKSIYHLLRFLFNFPKDVNAFRRIIRQSECDIVQICGLMCLQAGVAAVLSGKPIVWQLLSTFAPPPLRLFFTPFVGIFSTRIMTTGTSTAVQHPFYYLWKKKNIPFYPPVKEDIFYSSDEKQGIGRIALGFNKNDFVVGTLGNKNRQKNHAAFVDLISELRSLGDSAREMKFLIAGNDNPEYMHEYQQNVILKAEQQGLIQDGTLAITSSDLGPAVIINTMDVFILTSISEGTPTVIIEALACGKPVIAPNVGSISEMLQGNPYCLVYNQIDPSQIQKHIQKIINTDMEVVKQMCSDHFQSRFSYRSCIEAHVEAFNQCES